MIDTIMVTLNEGVRDEVNAVLVHGCGYDLFGQDILNGGSFKFYE